MINRLLTKDQPPGVQPALQRRTARLAMQRVQINASAPHIVIAGLLYPMTQPVAITP